MNLIKKIISELGGDEAHAITICPKKIAYFRGVKSVAELSSDKIVLISGKNIITIEGERLSADEYFQGDFAVKGSIERVSIE